MSFPTGTTLGSGQYLVVYADSAAPIADEIHLGFGLKQEGEGVFLIDWANFDPGDPNGVVDSVEFGPQLVDRSIARLPGAGWGLAKPTLGSPNISQPLGSPLDLSINEWFATGSYELGGQLFTDDFVELYNGGSLPASLEGLYLTDDPVRQPDKHQIQPLSFIDAGAYTVFVADANVGQGPDHVGFQLADERGWISLLDADLATLNTVYYGPQTSGVSQGRTPDGGRDYAFFTEPSPGLDTTPPSVPTGLLLDSATDTQVDFHWSASTDDQSGVAGYQIYRDGVQIGVTSATSYSDLNVVPDEAYFYQVSAVNGDGFASELSSAIGNILDTSPPSTPDGLAGTIVSSTEIDLVWNASTDPETGVQFYSILRDGLVIGTSTDAAFSDNGFDADSAVSYQVIATNNQNVSSAASLPWNLVALQQGVAPVADYGGTADTWISENPANVDDNFGDDVELEIDGEDPLETLGLIRWDVSEIPAGSTIDTVTITVNVNNSSNGQEYEIYAAARDWTEDQATWNLASAGAPWQTPGARGQQDRGVEVLGTLAPGATGTFTYGLNAAGVAAVQQWIDNPSLNYGLIISDESNSNGFEFDSSDNETIANRPRLTISYTGAEQPAPVSADFDSNGNVDGADFLAWQRGFGAVTPNATRSDGDADNDADVDGDDLDWWESQFTAGVAPLATGLSADPTTGTPSGSSAQTTRLPRSTDVVDVALAMALAEQTVLIEENVAVADDDLDLEILYEAAFALHDATPAEGASTNWHARRSDPVGGG